MPDSSPIIRASADLIEVFATSQNTTRQHRFLELNLAAPVQNYLTELGPQINILDATQEWVHKAFTADVSATFPNWSSSKSRNLELSKWVEYFQKKAGYFQEYCCLPTSKGSFVPMNPVSIFSSKPGSCKPPHGAQNAAQVLEGISDIKFVHPAYEDIIQVKYIRRFSPEVVFSKDAQVSLCVCLCVCLCLCFCLCFCL